MTSSPDNTVGIVLDDAFDMGVKDLSIDYLTLRKNMIKKIDSHYLSIFLEKIDGYLNSEDNDGIPNYDVPVMSILNELRTALQDRLGEK